MLCIRRGSKFLFRRLQAQGSRQSATDTTATSALSESVAEAGYGHRFLLPAAACGARGGDSGGDRFEAIGRAFLGALGVGLGVGFWQQNISAESRPGADRSALAAAKSYIRNVWNDVEHDLVEFGVNLPDTGEPKIFLVDDRLSVRLKVRKEADLSAVIVELVHGLTGRSGQLAVKDGAMKLKVAECGVARVLQFEKLLESNSPDGENDKVEEKALFAQVFVPTFSDDLPEVEFLKPGALSDSDLSVIGNVLRVSNAIRNNATWGDFQVEKMEEMMGKELEKIEGMVGFMLRDFHNFFEKKAGGRTAPSEWQSSPEDQDGVVKHRSPAGHSSESTAPSVPSDLVQKLEKMGVKVFLPNPNNKVDWGMIAGYEDQKRRIEDGLLLPLLHPQVFDDVARQTRKHFVTNRPRGVLFEGPPGTGKTTSARVIASQAAVPMVYIPLEAVMSKWYGEAEKLLANVFKNADELGGSIIFLDEIETLATTRGADMHEATRRLLGVLLREMDGFDTSKRTIVIGATNRKQDVDPALLSRFDTAVKFDLPDVDCRSLIIEQYAKHLSRDEVVRVAEVTKGMSGRDLRDVCEQTERSWASKIVREEVAGGQLPGIEEYLLSAKHRHKDLK
ncbi:hypothetical protein BSKO_07490 [Bryopsis sp. KO-2023]|nr:hypothetical protein BSKO_07490 [Bryopsis sp. KO-2023]